MERQIHELVAGLWTIFDRALVGVYLHGSAVLGGLWPYSDLDVIAVAGRSTTTGEKRRLAELLLALSGSARTAGPPRPIELELVVESEIRPWRYPPPFDFHYSEKWRAAFEHGSVEPWSRRTNRDLASVITTTLVGETALHGPPPEEVFEPVPRVHYVDAVLRDVETVDEYLESDTRNVVLTLPRIWSAVATDDVHSKDSAAAWALPRLPTEHRPVLAHARAVYRGEAEESWEGTAPQVRAYADHVLAQIERARIGGTA